MAWLGWTCGGVGAVFLWLGLLLQMSTDRFTTDDARIMMGAGLGAMLSGLGFVVAIEMVYPDAGKPVRAVQIAEANPITIVAGEPQKPLGGAAQAGTGARRSR